MREMREVKQESVVRRYQAVRERRRDMEIWRERKRKKERKREREREAKDCFGVECDVKRVSLSRRTERSG